VALSECARPLANRAELTEPGSPVNIEMLKKVHHGVAEMEQLADAACTVS
jgi:hypothetical protein